MKRLLTPSLLCGALLSGAAALGQVPIIDPLQPSPLPVPVPTLPTLPAPVSVPLPPPVSIPAPVLVPQPTSNPIGNPVGNPIQTPVGNPIGNPARTPLATPLGNPIQTPDVTAVGAQAPGAGRNQPGGNNQGLPKMRVYVGTYTNAKSQSEGIYQFSFDPNTGTLADQSLAAKASNPSFLAVHPSRKFLYAANEVGQAYGKPGGAVTGYAIDPNAGRLQQINAESSGGGDPCYVVVDSTGAFVLVANYSGGNLSVLPVGPDGQLGPPSETVQHKGSGANKSRQSSPHAHSVDFGPNNRYVIAADLGLDKLMIYHFDPKKGMLTPNIPPFAALAPGSGPRHLAFHPDGRHLYVINELANTITLFDFDPSRGTCSAIETVHTRPDPKKGTSYTAEVAVHPSGRYVYGSNRGDDSIAAFAVAPASGRITPIQYQPTGGKNPRHFAIDPTGGFLLVGNQDSNTISILKIDQASGRLTPVGDPVPCPAPVCIQFFPIAGS